MNMWLSVSACFVLLELERVELERRSVIFRFCLLRWLLRVDSNVFQESR